MALERTYLRVSDLSATELREVLDRASELRVEPRAHDTLLEDDVVALLPVVACNRAGTGPATSPVCATGC